MKRSRSIYTFIIALACLSLGLSSCVYNDTTDDERLSSSSSMIFLKLTVPDGPRITAITRADGTTPRVDFSTVNNMNLIFAAGDKITQIYYISDSSIEPGDGKVSMTSSNLPMTSDKNNNQRTIIITDADGELLKGVDCIYAVANYGTINISTVSTVTALKALQQKQEDGMPGKNADCMMFGMMSPLDENGKIKLNGEIQLERTLSMLSVKLVDNGLKEGVIITPKNISLHNVPTSCYIGQENQIGNSTTSVALGQQVDVSNWGSLSSENESLGGHDLEENTIPLFMFENLQGTSTAAADQIYKCPDEYSSYSKNPSELQVQLDKGKKYTYLQIDADYLYKEGEITKASGTIVYRFLLGDNIINDFNVRRNSYYQVTLNLKNYGGAKEDGKLNNEGNLVVNNNDLSWRVEMDFKDWGFVKDKFDFDAHAVFGSLDVIGDSEWKVTEVVGSGSTSGSSSWIRFTTDQGGTGWTEPTNLFNISKNGKIEYFIEPMTYNGSNGFTNVSGESRSITITITKTGTSETQTITFTQWTPIKITAGGETVYMERFEEEPMQKWGYQGYDLTQSQMISNLGVKKPYYFGYQIGRMYENRNAIYFAEHQNLDNEMTAHVYCYNKSIVPSGAGGASVQYYVLPDQETLRAMIKYTESNNTEKMEPMHYYEDYWTSSAENEYSKKTIYWDGKSQKFVSTEDRNAKKRVRAIYTTGANGSLGPL